jgi:hypothetical protein
LQSQFETSVILGEASAGVADAESKYPYTFSVRAKCQSHFIRDAIPAQ